MTQQDSFISFLLNSLSKIWESTGFANVEFGNLIMIVVGILFIYLAIKKGTDVDQPRNLAKSVTVK